MPRAGVTPERIAAEAEAIADEGGLDSVTLAAIALRLGVKMPSLYKHVEGLGAVREAVGERAFRELADVTMRATVGRSGADAVVALARAVREWAHAHPGRYAATVTAPRGLRERAEAVAQGEPAAASSEVAAAEAATEVAFGTLRGFGLEGDDLVDATRGLRALMHGYVTVEAAGGFEMPVDVDRSYDRLVDAFIRALPGYVSR